MLSEQTSLKLITIADIRKKALRIWQKGELLSAWLNHGTIFPLEIKFRKPRAAEMLENFDQVRDWIVMLRKDSKAECGKGYHLEYKQIQHRKMGEQNIPSRLYFKDMDDFLWFVAKTKEFSTFQKLCQQTLTNFPCLRLWLSKNPLKLLQQEQSWSQLLCVCAWFCEHPRPELYIRELDIEGVDSKFIEQHKSILAELLNIILPKESVNISISGLARHGFERRFGLRYDEPLIRFRLLDHKEEFSDISMPFSQFSAYKSDIKTVFITENKVNGLSFPNIPHAMVIFGLGYGVEMLKGMMWLQGKPIIYWGDIDTHGFSILSQLRSYFPQVQSLCMDESTLMAHKPLWGTESDDKRCLKPLQYLTQDEQQLLHKLQANNFGKNIRMEQERISFSCLSKALYE